MSSVLSIIQVYSALYSVDPRVVEAIVQVESKFNPNAISTKGAVGLMQVMPKYVHKTRKELLDPDTNIREGIQLLVKIKNECIHKEDFTYVVCYSLGSPRGNRVKHPKKFFYYKLFKKEYDHAENQALQIR